MKENERERERASLGPGLRADSILNEMKTMLSLDPRPSGTGCRFAKLSRSNVAELHGSHKVHRQGSPLCTVPLGEVS